MAENRQKVAKWIREMLPRKCCNCGSTKNLQYHHIVPAICGGNDVPSNIAVLCSDCHSKVHYGRDGIIDHGEAVKKGIKKAKESGRNVGRKKRNDLSVVLQTIAEYSTQFNPNSMTTEHEIMSMVNLKAVQYAKYKRKLISDMQADIWPYEWAKPVQMRKRPMYDNRVKTIRGDHE